MGLLRTIKVIKRIKDRDNGTIECKKNLNDVLELVRVHPKSGWYHGKFTIVKDKNWGTSYEIEKQVQDKTLGGKILSVLETYKLNIAYYQNVVYRIDANLDTYDAKACFKELKEALDKLPDVKGEVKIVKEAEKVDLGEKSIPESLKIFEEKVKAFGANPATNTFDTLKDVREQIGKKLDAQDPAVKAKYSQHFAQIDTYITAISMQLVNPAMANSIATFAGTYVSQMQAAISQMLAI